MPATPQAAAKPKNAARAAKMESPRSESLGGKAARDAQPATQPAGVLGDDDARHAAGRRQAEKCRPGSENVDSPGRQPQQHQGERDGPAELFQAAPRSEEHTSELQ